jgi:hypothetical protein
MWLSIAGASRMGAVVARAVVVNMLSAMPAANLARVLAVAGATISRSARWARLTWPISVSASRANISVTTGRWVRAWKVRGVTNSRAASVRIASTRAPALTRWLHRAAAL